MNRYTITATFTTNRAMTSEEWERLLGAVEAQIAEPAPVTIEERRADYQVTDYDIDGATA